MAVWLTSIPTPTLHPSNFMATGLKWRFLDINMFHTCFSKKGLVWSALRLMSANITQRSDPANETVLTAGGQASLKIPGQIPPNCLFYSLDYLGMCRDLL